MLRPLADDWNEYETQVLSTCSGDHDEIREIFLAGAACMLNALHEALVKQPSQLHKVTSEYAREIRTLLEPRPGKGK